MTFKLTCEPLRLNPIEPERDLCWQSGEFLRLGCARICDDNLKLLGFFLLTKEDNLENLKFVSADCSRIFVSGPEKKGAEYSSKVSILKKT